MTDDQDPLGMAGPMLRTLRLPELRILVERRRKATDPKNDRQVATLKALEAMLAEKEDRSMTDEKNHPAAVRPTLRQRVLEFHATIGQPSPTEPTIPGRDRVALRASLITEEYFELMRSLYGLTAELTNAESDVNYVIQHMKPAPYMAELADACADLAYVVEGTNIEFGIDGEAIMDEVHRANMAKANGPKRADGKALKGPNWTPPDIAGELRRQGWKG